MTDDDYDDLMQLAKMHADASSPSCECPSCGHKLSINMRESLDPYTVSFKITPMAGRASDAKMIGAQIRNMSRLFETLGKEYDHETQSVLMGVEVDDDMATTIRMGFIPKDRDKDTTP